MKLLSNRDKDKTHIHDMIGVGLIDKTWTASCRRFWPSDCKPFSTRPKGDDLPPAPLRVHAVDAEVPRAVARGATPK